MKVHKGQVTKKHEMLINLICNLHVNAFRAIFLNVGHSLATIMIKYLTDKEGIGHHAGSK